MLIISSTISQARKTLNASDPVTQVARNDYFTVRQSRNKIDMILSSAQNYGLDSQHGVVTQASHKNGIYISSQITPLHNSAKYTQKKPQNLPPLHLDSLHNYASLNAEEDIQSGDGLIIEEDDLDSDSEDQLTETDEYKLQTYPGRRTQHQAQLNITAQHQAFCKSATRKHSEHHSQRIC